MVYVDFMADREAKMKAEQEAAIERGRQEYLAEQRRREREEREREEEEADTSSSSTERFGSSRYGRLDGGASDSRGFWDSLDVHGKQQLCATQGCKRSSTGKVLDGPYCKQCSSEGFFRGF